MRETDLAQDVEHALLSFGLWHVEILQLQVDVLLYGQFIDEVETLEHEADATLAESGAFILLQMSYLNAIQKIIATVGSVEQSEDAQ